MKILLFKRGGAILVLEKPKEEENGYQAHTYGTRHKGNGLMATKEWVKSTGTLIAVLDRYSHSAHLEVVVVNSVG